ncbi:MAG: TetR/AcrR family transcriptional regulator [Defluviitaleaceae bacterium]|nr:TetR/AcrR family transcriptional regulator [Defluviitaleaceae bacterium]
MPRNKYPEETVKKILDVSLKLFLEKGFEQTTVLDIVNNLGGLTRGAFYHHFKSKEEVLEALTERLFSETNPMEKVKQEKGLNGLDKLRLLMKQSVVEGFADEKKVALDKIALPLLSNPRFLAMHVKGIQEAALSIIPFIEEGMADGSIRPRNAKVLADLFMLLFSFWMIPTIYPCDDDEAGDRIMVIKEMLDACGFPLLDEDLLESLENLAALEYLLPKSE